MLTESGEEVGFGKAACQDVSIAVEVVSAMFEEERRGEKSWVYKEGKVGDAGKMARWDVGAGSGLVHGLELQRLELREVDRGCGASMVVIVQLHDSDSRIVGQVIPEI